MKLSIVIPVYQVEKYLRKCLNSCLNQNVLDNDYEIICINDGSKDNCAKILEEYKVRYPLIKVITQVNQGLSAARNNGLKIAKGEYVWFIDSDDWIEDNCLANIMKRLKNIDILQLSYQKVYENNNKILKIYGENKSDVILSGKEVILRGGLPSEAQVSIYRRLFLVSNNLKFVEGRVHEDIEFKPRATFLADSISWYRPIVYNYLQRTSGNIMSSFKLKNGIDIIYAIRSLNDFIKKYKVEKPFSSSLYSISAKYFNSLMNVYGSLDRQQQKMLQKAVEEASFIFQNMKKADRIKYRIQGLVFEKSFTLGKTLLKLAKKI